MRDALGNVQSVLVLGGGSDIALATVRRLVAARTRTVVLAAHHPDRLGDAAAELRTAGATTVEVVPFDASATDGHPALVDDLFDRFGDFDVVLIAFGVLGDQARAEQDVAAALEIARVNYLGTVSVAVPLAHRMRAQGHGTIVALSSVAGERVRRSNFVYGSSKAGMDGFLLGLGDSLTDSGVKVLVVRPGFVRTKMTEGLDAAPLSTTPDAVADAIVTGLARGSETVWVPGTLRYVMMVLRHLPRPIFRRLPL
ncbi:MAG: decaprenylphospho-beta-D-erythro-pentofuranosid-2-ulose 2-reductase [Actinomycetota bacterium]